MRVAAFAVVGVPLLVDRRVLGPLRLDPFLQFFGDRLARTHQRVALVHQLGLGLATFVVEGLHRVLFRSLFRSQRVKHVVGPANIADQQVGLAVAIPVGDVNLGARARVLWSIAFVEGPRALRSDVDQRLRGGVRWLRVAASVLVPDDVAPFGAEHEIVDSIAIPVGPSVGGV